MKKLYFLVFAIFALTNSFAQSINNYKYVIVPQQFEFLSGVDEHQLNSLTIFLFEKYGFEAYREGLETPAEVYADNCNILRADVVESSNFIRTKLRVVLKDCNDREVFMSEVGESKDKDYKKAYHEALREAFLSIEELNYQYSETSVEAVETPKVIASNSAAYNEKTEVAVSQQPIDTLVPKKIKEVNNTNDVSIVYLSTNSPYKIVFEKDTYTIYDGTKEVGTAQKTDDGNFKVVTSDFSGRGVIDGNTFIIEREIRGVGLVEMRFIKE